MSMMKHEPEDGWVPAQPLEYIGDDDIDFEVYDRKHIAAGLTGWHWQAYYRDELLDSGDARTLPGLVIAMWRAGRRLRRQIARAAQ